MSIKGLVGAVYKNDTAPTTDNIALLFDWVLEVEHRKEYTYGPELHAVSTGWSVKAEAYWAAEQVPKGKAFVRLFIGKGEDLRCLTGEIELPALEKTDGIEETTIKLIGGSNPPWLTMTYTGF
jgi:hypothetical protein